MIWEDVLFFGFIWLFVAVMIAGIFCDDKSFTEMFARTIWWPLILPILLVKMGFYLLRWLGEVAKEQPAALTDLWRLK